MQDWTYGQGPHIFAVIVRSLPVFIFASRILRLSTAGAVRVLRTEQFSRLSVLPTRKQTLLGPVGDTYVVLHRKPKSLRVAVNFPAISHTRVFYLRSTPPSYMASCLPLHIVGALKFVWGSRLRKRVPSVHQIRCDN